MPEIATAPAPQHMQALAQANKVRLARAELKRHSGTQFDSEIVSIFLTLLEREERAGESLTARVSRVLR